MNVGGELTPTHTFWGKSNFSKRGAFFVSSWNLCQ
jgi:hypothetical protein